MKLLSLPAVVIPQGKSAFQEKPAARRLPKDFCGANADMAASAAETVQKLVDSAL